MSVNAENVMYMPGDNVMPVNAENVIAAINVVNEELIGVNHNLYYCVYQYYQEDGKHGRKMSDHDQQDMSQVKKLLWTKIEADLDRLARRALWLKENGGVIFNYVKEKASGNIPPPPEDPPPNWP